MKFNEIFMRDRPPPERGAFLETLALALTQKMKKCEYCQSENAPKVSQKFACQLFFLQMARAEIRTDHAGQKYTFT